MQDNLHEKIKRMSASEQDAFFSALRKAKGKKKSRCQPYPLSNIQRLFYFHHHFQPLLCNIPAAVKIDGPLDVVLIELTLQSIISRHDALIAAITTNAAGTPVQQVNLQAKMTLACTDLSMLKGKLQDAELHTCMQTNFKEPFNLARPPLIRAALIKLSNDRHVLTLSIHHICADGWSIGVLLDEFVAAYSMLKRGKTPSINRSDFQYVDYVAWENSIAHQSLIQRQLAYWKKTLAGASFLLDFPTDYLRSAERTGRGNTMTYLLSLELSQRIRQFCSHNGFTLFMFMSAIYALMIYRYTGQGDFLIGTPISVRNPRETECLIGVFLNMIVLRFKPKSCDTFMALLEHVREVSLAAYSHADCPIIEVIKALQPDQQPGFSTLFQLFITHNNAPVKPIQCLDLKLSPMLDEAGGADADIGFFYLDADEKISLRIEYATDLYKSSTISRLFRNIDTALSAVLDDPYSHLLTVNCVSKAERQQLTKFSSPPEGYNFSQTESYFSLINDRVQQSPSELCLYSNEDKCLTYGELVDAVNYMHLFLGLNQFELKTVVAVYLDTSIESTVAMLAIFKAGLVYLPIDVMSPKERVSFILDDAEVGTVICSKALFQEAVLPSGQCTFIDDFWAQYKQTNEKTKALFTVPSLSEADIAYLIYTSGTTGQPKASLNTHVALSQKMAWHLSSLFNMSDRMVSVGTCSLAFDVSIWEALSALVSGATYHCVSYDIRRDPNALAAYINSSAITHFVCVPSVLTLLLESDHFQSASSLEAVACVGEHLTPSLCSHFYTEQPTADLYNYYGPSECSIMATAAKCSPEDVVSIGRPIAANSVHVLSKEGVEQPIGVSGEIFLSGSGLAAGYHNRIELTTKKFISVPTISKEGKFYRTGDLGYWSEEGELFIQGRLDNQAKFNGIRVELDEIESRLEQHDAVSQAVVLVLKNPEAGVQQLHAYVTTKCFVEDDSLRAHLKLFLPASLVPSVYHRLDKMPLNVSDKKDRLKVPHLMRDNIQQDMSAQLLQDAFYTEVWRLFSPQAMSAVAQTKSIYIDTGNTLFTAFKTVVSQEVNASCLHYTTLDVALDTLHITSDVEVLRVFIPGVPSLASGKDTVDSELCEAFALQSFVFDYLRRFLCSLRQSVTQIIEVCYVTLDVKSEHGSAVLVSLQSVLLGMLVAMSAELPNFSYSAIDFSSKTVRQAQDIAHLCGLVPRNSYLAWHDEKFWRRQYEPVPIPAVVDGRGVLSSGDTYIVVGFGGIAKILAKFLVDSVACHLIVITRTQQLTADNNDDIKLLAEKALSIKCYQADIANETSVRQLLRSLADDHLKIHGVVSTIGVFKAGTIREMTLCDIQATLSPKVQGTILLHDSFSKMKLKFFYLCSSSTTVSYDIGTTAYYTANLFLDNYVNMLSKSSNMMTIRWGMWRDVGMSSSENIQHKNDVFTLHHNKYALSSDQAIEAFKRVLACPRTSLLVTFEPVPVGDDATEKALCYAKPKAEGVALLSFDNDELQPVMLDIWKSVLRVPSIEPDKSFFELGGHSLMATQLLNKIKQQLGAEIGLGDFFKNPSFHAVLSLVSGKN